MESVSDRFSTPGQSSEHREKCMMENSTHVRSTSSGPDPFLPCGFKDAASYTNACNPKTGCRRFLRRKQKAFTALLSQNVHFLTPPARNRKGKYRWPITRIQHDSVFAGLGLRYEQCCKSQSENSLFLKHLPFSHRWAAITLPRWVQPFARLIVYVLQSDP